MAEVETAELEIFIPGPGENEDDPNDAERREFLAVAQELLDAGLDIAVYSTDTYPSAFRDCAPVADQIEIAGYDVLPIMLVDGAVKVSYNYPDREQLERFSKARAVKPKKISAAAAACGPVGGGQDVATAPAMEPAGFAAVLAGVTERPVGGPDIGGRRNLMGWSPESRASEEADSGRNIAGQQVPNLGTPNIGGRRNLMGGDFGDGLPGSGESAARTSSGGCCGGSCGCGGH